MRFLHTADLHLGRQFCGLSLEEDHQTVLDQVVEAVVENEIELLVIAGDVYDRGAPPNSAVRQFNAFMDRITKETEAALALIAGNHDSGDRIGSMSIMTDSGRALIRGPLLQDERPLVLRDRYGEVAISGLPFSYEFAARECFKVDNIATPEDVLRAQVGAARALVPGGARWVIVAHAFVAGGKTSDGERPIMRAGGIETVSPEIFEGAHYVALGHLHRPQSAGAPHIRYSGAPLTFGFDEVGDAKSMTLVDLAAGGEANFWTIPFRPLRGVRTIRGLMADLLVSERSNDFVKVVLTDEKPLIDPMKQLREVFPHACDLSYARDEKKGDGVGIRIPDQLRINDPECVIADFVELVRGEALNEAELELIKAELFELQEKELAI